MSRGSLDTEYRRRSLQYSPTASSTMTIPYQQRRPSMISLQNRRPSLIDKATSSGAAMTSQTSNEPERRDSITILNTSIYSKRPSLYGIPPYYEEAKHSTEIVRKYRDPEEIVKPHEKLVKKAAKHAIDIEEHKYGIPYLCAINESKFDEETSEAFGITFQMASKKLAMHGYNILSPPRKMPVIVKFIKQFLNLFSLMLIIASVLTFLTLTFTSDENYGDIIVLGSALLVVTFVNALITFIEERKSEKILEGFSELTAKRCRLIREGKIMEMDVKNLVVGDIVLLKGGDKVPADLRVLKSTGMKVDNSSLTGESEAQPVTKEMTHKNPLETNNLIFCGTLCVEGDGLGMVIRTGNNTVIGQIASLASTTLKIDTPLRKDINAFVRTIGFIAVLMSLAFFIVGFIIGVDVTNNIIFAIGIIVANIPQGLIATVSLALSISAKRLAKRNVLVKNLESVETLGSTTLIASDKTGTLTQNCMTVVELWFDGGDIIQATQTLGEYHIQSMNQSLDLSASSIPPLQSQMNSFPKKRKTKKYYQKPDFRDEQSLTTLQLIQRSAAICSRTVFDPSPENLKEPVIKRKAIGDASETALLKYYALLQGYPDIDDIRDQFPKVFEIPFNSTNKWHISIHKDLTLPESAPRILIIKGAPERVIEKCSTIRLENNIVDLDEDSIAKYEQIYESMARKGERVFGFAIKYLSSYNGYPPEMDSQYGPHNVPKENYCFLGMVGLQDPPKAGVMEAVDKCKLAGVQVVMVTGDHQLTAKAIAKQIGIITDQTAEDLAAEKGVPVEFVDPLGSPAVVLNGEQLEILSDAQWDMILKKKQIVFSRTTPQQKLLIVEKFQGKGHVCGVTGDGVNDSPALKKANIGISMGITGSDVSKEAASLILLDDNFASIVNGIEEGRVIFDNLKKSIAYTLSHILPEIIPFLLFLLIGLPLPLNALLILSVDIGTELISAISFAYEKSESDILLRPPRNPEDRLVGFSLLSYAYLQVGVIESLSCLFSYFVVFGFFGIPPSALLFTSDTYFQPNAPDFVFNGITLNQQSQLQILSRAQSAYFASLVLCQLANLISCKTRINSLFQQGILRNWVMILGAVFSIVICCAILYIPFVNNVIFGTYPLEFIFWLPPIPFIILIILFGEWRKFLIRNFDNSVLLW